MNKAILTSIALAVCFAAAGVEPAIVSGPIINPANGHFYYLTGPAFWADAEAQAIGLGGHLVTINDAAENAWIYNTFSSFGGVPRELSIGLTDEGHEGVWTWVSGERRRI